MKNCPLKSNPFSVRNFPESICRKPQPDQMIEYDMIEVFPKEVKWSGESKMSEEVRFSKQSRTSKNSAGINLLRRSSNFTNDNLKFVSIISSDNSQKLFKHKCTHIEDEYLTCECNKYPKEICRQLQCGKTCVSFKIQNNPQLYETVRDSTSSVNTASGISQSLLGSTGYCEMPNAKPQVKLHKEQPCKCEVGRCRNHKCPCKKNGQFCDFNVCDCRECRNLILFSKIQDFIEKPSDENLNEQQSHLQQRGKATTEMEEENSAQFEQINFFINIKTQPMDEQS